MKLYKFLLLALLLMFSTSSCKKDFLEVVDKTVLLRQGYVVDLATTGHFLNGVYVNLANNYLHTGYLAYSEIIADNMKPTGSEFSVAYNWAATSESGGASNTGNPLAMWQAYYGMVRDCSFVIEKANEYADQDQVKSDEIKGQAFALRGMVQFLLVNIFAQSYNFSDDASHPGIPVIKTSNKESAVSRQSVGEAYNAIVEDLNNALQLLPANNSFPKDRMNHQAVKSLLARTYLFMGDFINAKMLSRQVLNDVPIMVAGYPQKLYTRDETEAIFQMPPGQSNNYTPIFMGYYARLASPLFLATTDIADILREDMNDKRSSWVAAISSSPVTWRITKFPISAAGGLFPIKEGDYYQTIFRSSEMYLTAAECYAKLNMEDSARFFIDAIRKRANPTIKDITASGASLIDSIYKERRKELCFDGGLRMYDLLRWKRPVNRMDALNPNVKNLPYPSNKAIAPIPKTDVDLSGLPQNPGY